MAAYSQDYYDTLRQNCPALPIYPLGLCVVAAQESAAALQESYLPSARLTRLPDAAGGIVRPPAGVAAWAGSGGHYADAYALVQALARDLRPRVSLLEGMRVTAVQPAAAGVMLQLGTGQALTAHQVILAPGPWLHDPAWHALVAPLGLRVKKIVALHIEQAPAPGDPVIVLRDEDNAFLLPVWHRGHWLLSYTCPVWGVDPDAPPAGLDASAMAGARAILERYAPRLAQQPLAGRVCSDAYSESREPVLCALDDHGQVIFAGAANGSGYRLAPAIAAAAVDLLQIS
jgi:hypothetical protein